MYAQPRFHACVRTTALECVWDYSIACCTYKCRLHGTSQEGRHFLDHHTVTSFTICNCAAAVTQQCVLLNRRLW